MSQPNLPVRRYGSIVPALVAVAMFLAASSSFGADPYPWKLQLAPAASIAGDRVMLGEIAEPVGDIDPETWKILAATPLWPFPGREGQITLSRGKVQDDLDRIFSGSTRNFIVPDQIVLRKGGGAPLATNDLRKLVVEFLTEKMGGAGNEVEVKDVVLPQQIFLREDTERLSVDIVGAPTPGRMSLRLTVSSLDGRILKQIAANAQVNVWRVIPVANRGMGPKDGPITEERFIFERRNLATIHGTPMDAKSVMPMRVKYSIGPGAALTSENTEPVPAITKGEQVTMVWNGPHISLSMPVVALTDGAKGGQISVRNVQGGKEIGAIVKDERTVMASK